MTITNQSSRLVAVAAGVAVALVLMLGASMPVRAAGLTAGQVQSILSLLASFGADQATLNNVTAALNGQPTSGTGGTTTGGTTAGGLCPYTWSRTLQSGSTGADVKALQQFLNMSAATMVAASGAGSPGMETMTFGPATMKAVMAFQTANGISSIGIVGPATRAKLNSLCGGTTSNPGTNPGPVTSGSGLTVSLAATSPNNSVLVAGQSIGDLGEFTFTNPSSAPITVTGLSFMRTGVSNDATINNVYLYNGVTRITDSAGVSAGQFSFANSAGVFTVPAMSNMTIAVRADITTGTSGQQIGVQLTSVTASGSVGSTFPISSGFQTISAANLASADFGATTLPSATTISPQAAFSLWQNTVSVSTNPVWLKSVRLTNLGSADNTAVSNLRLYVDGTQVGATVPAMNADRSVTFDLTAAPVSLATQSHVIKVLGDVVGGASRTIQLSVQRSGDLMFVDSQLNQPILPTNNGSNFSAVSAGIVTINSASASGVSVTKSPNSPVNDVSVGASSVKFASFDFLASGEPVKVSDLYVYADTNEGVGLDNGKVYLNGVQVGSTRDIVEGNGSSVAYGSATDFSLGSSMILQPGTVQHIDIYADAKSSTSTNLVNGATVLIYLAVGSSNGQGQISLTSTNVPSGSNASANTINITSSSLTATKYSGYSNQTLIAGTTGAKIGSFTLSAGSTEAIDVNTIGLSLSSATGVTNLRLTNADTGAAIGTTVTTPTTGTNSFSVNLPLAASQTQTVNVYADLLSSAASVTATLKASGATTGTGHVTGIAANVANDVTLQAITIGTGQLFGNNGASNPVATNVVAGQSNLKVGNFRFSASNSGYMVTKLLVKILNGSASAVSSVILQYKDANGTTQTATQALANPGTGEVYATATFTGLTYAVPLNGASDLDVYVSTPSVTNSTGISGSSIKAYIDRINGFQAQDSSGNATTSPFTGSDLNSNNTAGYGLLVLRKSVPTFAGLNYQSNSQPNSGSDLYRFTVTADAAGPVDIYKLSFRVATATMKVTSWNLYDAANPGTALTGSAADVSDTSGNVSFTPTNVISVPAGGSKTFYLRATTFTGWASGAYVTVNLATADASILANTTASGAASGNLYVWSDQSASNHTTSSSDWTNGYLLKNLTDGTYNYSY